MSESGKETKIEKLMARLRNLPSSKKLGEDALRRQAERIINEKEQKDRIEMDSIFVSSDEKQKANELLEKYLHDYTIESVSDINTLKQLIFLEILDMRLRKGLNDFYTQSEATPKEMLQNLHQNNDKIILLKEKLGITRDKKDKEITDGYAFLRKLMEKHKIWLSENQGSRHVTCGHCGKQTMLKIRMEAWEAQKHPWFKDRVLGNPRLVDLFKEGKITQKDLAAIFEVSPDYVTWLVSKWKIENGQFKEHEEAKASE